MAKMGDKVKIIKEDETRMIKGSPLGITGRVGRITLINDRTVATPWQENSLAGVNPKTMDYFTVELEDGHTCWGPEEAFEVIDDC